MARKEKSGKKRNNVTTVTPTRRWQIEQTEYDARLERVRQELEKRKLDALVVFHPIRMAYLSGFYHLSTERPMAIVVPANGGLGALIPLLEREHLAKATGVSTTKVYPEYPTGGTKHPMEHLADLLAELGVNKPKKRIGYDSNGYLDINSYDGPELSAVIHPKAEAIRARDLVDRLRYVKSETEITLISQSAIWGNLAHRLMHESLALGANPVALSMDASSQASRLMMAALGPGYQPLTSPFGANPVGVSFSAGANTAVPHALPDATGIRRGDVLVTYAGADVGGYQSELERTMIVGEPPAAFAESFAQMLHLQQVGFDALRPGRQLADAEADVVAAFAELGLTDQQRHHTGHGIGLEGHEGPFIDLGDDTVIEEGMVFSVEPGLYVPGLAGFRHSDTVVVRATGAERLTPYPRDLASLTVDL